MEVNTIITGIITPLIALIPTLYLIWRDRKQKEPSLAIRIIRKKSQIRKIELYNKTRMEKLLLELKALEEEAEYQNRMSKWESGETATKINELTQKGEQIIQKGTRKVQQEVENLKEKGGKIFDQAKNLKNKFLGSDQEK